MPLNGVKESGSDRPAMIQALILRGWFPVYAVQTYGKDKTQPRNVCLFFVQHAQNEHIIGSHAHPSSYLIPETTEGFW
jgi:hypothetical protein